MRKMGMLFLVLALLVSLVGACGQANEKNKDNEGKAGAGNNKGNDEKKDVKLRIFQFKVEIAEALNRLKDDYKKETGVTLEIETVGGGADYGAALKAKFASGDEPDIFNNGGWNEAIVWKDKLEDLSGEPWVGDLLEATKEQITLGGKLVGMPMNTEGYGFLYNKDLFEKAGITEIPDTLDELAAACEKLQAAGITPFMNGYKEWWVLGLHNLNNALAKQQDPTAFINDVKTGAQTFKGNAIMQDWVKLLDLTVKYSQQNPLTTDYNAQVTQFAAGQAAMMQQGNWTQVQITGVSPEIKLGVLPMPINNDATLNGNIFVGVPNNWVVNKNSKNKDEAKAFLKWLVTSDTGKRYIVEEFKFMPAFTNIPYTTEQLGDIAAAIQDYSKNGKTLGWHWPKLPDGAGQEMGAAMQAYIAGEIDANAMLDRFDTTVQNLAK